MKSLKDKLGGVVVQDKETAQAEAVKGAKVEAKKKKKKLFVS